MGLIRCGTLENIALFSNGEVVIRLRHRRSFSFARCFAMLLSNFNYDDDDDIIFPRREGDPAPPKPKGGAYDKVFLGIAITITAIWAIGTIIQIAYPRHAVPQTANYVMIAVAGAFFGGSLVTRGGNGRR